MTTLVYRDTHSGAALVYRDSLYTAPVGDTTAPVLTAASATATGPTTATGTVTTNEAGGTLYWLANASATATATQVKAGSSKAVTATGAQSVSLTGLPAASTLYLHFLHADGAATPNESAVANTASFTTTAAADIAGPEMQGAIAVTKTATTITLIWPSATDASGVGEYFASMDGAAAVSTGMARTKTYTGLAAQSLHQFEVTARDTLGNLTASPLTATVLTDAAGTDPDLVSKTIVVTLKGRDLSVRPNAAGINWEWSDARGVVTSSGTGLVGSASGVLTVPIRTRLLSDGEGRLSIDNYSGGNILTYFASQLWVRVP